MRASNDDSGSFGSNNPACIYACRMLPCCINSYSVSNRPNFSSKWTKNLPLFPGYIGVVHTVGSLQHFLLLKNLELIDLYCAAEVSLVLWRRDDVCCPRSNC